MEFLVQIAIDFPHGLPRSERETLAAAERVRGLELKRSGIISRIWRVPGKRANVGVWQAADATQLHEALASLPLFDFADIAVTPLACHYLEAETGR
jgi:muconolactone D-isomerase